MNQSSYTTRKADKSWIDAINQLVPTETISLAADVGCGGGIYTKALADLGIEFVTGVDFSDSMLNGARDNCKEYENISFKHGNAFETGLESNSYDLLLERALIHHIEDLHTCFKEGYRILKDGGYYIVQDRTPDDCLLEGNETHVRGYFFELFPKLIDMETKRRFESEVVVERLKEAGFKNIKEVKLWEKRKKYEDKGQLLNDIKARTGRSILHELDDEELKLLIDHLDESLGKMNSIVEKDRWTIWKAEK
nr:class I SAM-dependent methyltransferase [Evansella tamaricis]